MYNLRKLGVICGDHRRKIGYTQLKAAIDLGYTPENISAFECGRNDSVKIFLWYLEKADEEFIKKIKECKEWL